MFYIKSNNVHFGVNELTYFNDGIDPSIDPEISLLFLGNDDDSSTFRPPGTSSIHTNTNPRIHSLTSLCSTSAVCERAVCVVTSPLRVVCSAWFTLWSVFLLAHLEVPSGKHNLCAYEIINKSVPKLCWLLLRVDRGSQCSTSFTEPVGLHF